MTTTSIFSADPFLLACTAMILGTVAFATSGKAGEPADVRDPNRPVRAALFQAEGFPTVDSPVIEKATLDAALAGLPVERLGSVSELDAKLRVRNYDALVLPYGSAFPEAAWPAIRNYLNHGGSLVVLGGAPFYQPVRTSASDGGGTKWLSGPRQPTYAHELLIGPAEPVSCAPLGALQTVLQKETGWKTPFPAATTCWALTVRLSTRKDNPDEDGSAGPRDAVLRPLVHVVDSDGVARGCPLLELDRQRGIQAGGRWVLAPSDAKLTAEVIRAMVERALEGSSELVVRPLRASVEPGETPTLRVSVRRFVPRTIDKAPRTALIIVRDERDRKVFADEVTLAGPAELRTGLITIGKSLSPGLYHVRVETPDASWSPRAAVGGFWVKDAKLLHSGPKLSVSRDWLRKDGKVFPVIGTTYMASDVHRKFLFEPNPHVWDADFAEMERRGINLVRTGLWTAWERAMLDPGAIDEGILAALDAYVLTAAKHNIVVCFNFFAFVPQLFSGQNAFLDPRSIEGQRELLTLVASRYQGVGWIHWDLINEPSYAPRQWVWNTRPIRDPAELAAWKQWVLAHHGKDESVVRERWRDIEDDLFASPRDEEFAYTQIREGHRPRKVRDFMEYTQDTVAAWAKQMRDILRAAGGEPLVTLGQDEGGLWARPGQQFFAPSLDYTSVHTWWLNDDLLWDGVLTKVPEKPNLHQETGLMRLEDADGNPWRSPAVAAQMLERKVAYAFLSRGAGAIEWAWNINPYQPIDNESVIGIFRPDGTAKPELRALTDAAAFFRKAAPLLDDFEADPVVLVIPHARGFSMRPGAIDATKPVIRTLADRYGIVPTALSDLRLTATRLSGAKLIIVPDPEVLDENAARALLDARRAGAKILITGAIEGDSYGNATDSLKALGILSQSRPVTLHEDTSWSPTGQVTFEGQLQENLRRSVEPSLKSLEGDLWHEPLPLELAHDREALANLLGSALAKAGVATNPGRWGVAARVLYARKAALVVCVNESAELVARRVSVDGRSLEIPVPALGTRLILVDRPSGTIAAATPGEPIRPVVEH